MILNAKGTSVPFSFFINSTNKFVNWGSIKMISFKNFISENKDALPDVKGHQSKGSIKYYEGIPKKKKAARSSHFEKQAKMSDDNPAAYKKAPGDHGEKTSRLSKHTKKVMKMYPSLYKDKKKTNESIIGMAKRAVKGIASDRKTGQALQHMHDVHKDQKPGNDSFNQMNRDKARHFQMALRHHNNGDIEKRNQHINRGLKQDKGYPDPRDVGTSNSDQHRSHRNHLNSVVGMRESKIDPIQSPMVDPMDLRGRPPKRNPYPNSPYGMKHPLHPLNIKKNKKPVDTKEETIYEDPSKSLKDKSEKSGIPAGILRSVYNRGMAAWKGGHRKGAGQQQWAHARVNSFISKGSGTWGKADKDLAAKARAAKSKK